MKSEVEKEIDENKFVIFLQPKFDIFTEKEQQEGITVTKYINKEGLKEGTYQFLVEIDGKIYNTGRYGKINE